MSISPDTGSSDVEADATAILRRLVGNESAEFHDGQLEAIEALVTDRSRALVVQRTGWGKSAVYFIATLLLRQRGAGPSILVSPLLALMRDQVAAAARAGVRAVTLNSANAHEWDEVRAAIARDEVDVLLVSPERLNNPRFRDEQLPDLLARTGLLVVDEAHCISDWGHDFRPDYRRLRHIIAGLASGVPVLATTATANSRVVADVAEQLSAPGTGVVTIRGPLARASLRLGVLTLPNSQARLGWLLSHLAEMQGSGIIYALTVSAAEDTARLLRDAGHKVLAYTGRTDTGDREAAEAKLKNNEVKALVATSALGMGFDKPDLGFVIHLGAPSSPVAYYQQVGRAGRATERADVMLLPGREDAEIWHYFATSSMPNEARARAVIDALAGAGRALSTPALEALVDLRRTPLELLLKVLDVDGAVAKVQGGWLATGRAWSYDADRYERIAAERVAEQQSMLDYESSTECRMAFLQRALDDPTAAACGRCDNCTGVWFRTEVVAASGAAAATSLERAGVEIEPRTQWPTGAETRGVPVKGRIDASERLQPGRALARLTDLGWGGTLRTLFAASAVDAPASRALIRAAARVLGEWGWDERPAAIVSVPSRWHPILIESIAQGLAELGKIPYAGALSLVNGGPTGSPGGNSVYRLSAVWKRFEVSASLAADLAPVAGRPLLLIDDLVDSRWTLTVAGRELRRATGSPVLPFVLAAKM